MKRDNRALARIGEALYGPSYRTPLYEALGVSERTMRRWLNGEFNIPEGVWDELQALCNTRGKALAIISAELRLL